MMNSSKIDISKTVCASIISCRKMCDTSASTSFDDVFKQAVYVFNRDSGHLDSSQLFESLSVGQAFLLDVSILKQLCSRCSLLPQADTAMRKFMCRFTTASPPTFIDFYKHYCHWSKQSRIKPNPDCITPDPKATALKISTMEEFLNKKFTVVVGSSQSESLSVWRSARRLYFFCFHHWAIFLCLQNLWVDLEGAPEASTLYLDKWECG